MRLTRLAVPLLLAAALLGSVDVATASAAAPTDTRVSIDPVGPAVPLYPVLIKPVPVATVELRIALGLHPFGRLTATVMLPDGCYGAPKLASRPVSSSTVKLTATSLYRHPTGGACTGRPRGVPITIAVPATTRVALAGDGHRIITRTIIMVP